MDINKLKSLYLDFEKGVFKLNDEDMDAVFELHLDFEEGKWFLTLTKDEVYENPHIITTKKYLPHKG